MVVGDVVWKQDAGSDRMIVDFINVKCKVGQEVHHPFGVRTLFSDIF
jgi:hypothetical protein